MINLRPDENGKVTTKEESQPTFKLNTVGSTTTGYLQTTGTSTSTGTITPNTYVGGAGSTLPYPTTTGYTCPNCKMWVYNGAYHYCSYVPNVPPTTQYHYHTYTPQDFTSLLNKMDELLKEMKAIKKELAKLK